MTELLKKEVRIRQYCWKSESLYTSLSTTSTSCKAAWAGLSNMLHCKLPIPFNWAMLKTCIISTHLNPIFSWKVGHVIPPFEWEVTTGNKDGLLEKDLGSYVSTHRFPIFLVINKSPVYSVLTNGQENLTVVFAQHGESGFSLLKQEDLFNPQKHSLKGLLLAWSHLCCREYNIKFENQRLQKKIKTKTKTMTKITSYLKITTNTPPLLIKVDCRICIASSIDTISGLKIETVVNRRLKINQ